MNQIGTNEAIICPSVEFDKHLDWAWEIYEQNWIRIGTCMAQQFKHLIDYY